MRIVSTLLTQHEGVCFLNCAILVITSLERETHIMDSHSKETTPSSGPLGIIFNTPHTDEPVSQSKAQEVAPEKQEASEKKSHLSNTGNVFNVTKAFEEDDIEVGTIVTDKRKHQSSLISNLHSAFNEWWGKTKEGTTGLIEEISVLATHTDERPVISKAETRTEVVQEATTQAAIAPKDDYAHVVEKIRTFDRDVSTAPNTPFTIKQLVDDKHSWSHTLDEFSLANGEQRPIQNVPTTEPATPDFRATAVAPAVETHIKKNIPERDLTKSPVREANLVIEKGDAAVPTPVRQIASVHIPDAVQKRNAPLPKTTVIVAPLIHGETAILHTGPSVAEVSHEPSARTREIPLILEEPTPAQKIEPVATKTAEPEKREEKPLPKIEVTSLSATEHGGNRSSVPEFHSVPREQRRAEQKEPEALVEEAPTFSSREIPTRTTHAERPQKSIWWVLFGGALVIVLILTVSIGVRSGMFKSTTAQNTETSGAPITVPSFFTTDVKAPVALTDRETLLASLSDLVRSTSADVAQFYPTATSAEGATRIATAAEFFATISAHLSGTTIRALESDFMLGSVRTTKSEPFIIFQSYNFDLLFSGLLAWEPYLYSDLYPFFGDVPQNVLPFVDTIRDNKPARVFFDREGNEVLLYAFINQSTVVITTSSAALSKLLEHL